MITAITLNSCYVDYGLRNTTFKLPGLTVVYPPTYDVGKHLEDMIGIVTDNFYASCIANLWERCHVKRRRVRFTHHALLQSVRLAKGEWTQHGIDLAVRPIWLGKRRTGYYYAGVTNTQLTLSQLVLATRNLQLIRLQETMIPVGQIKKFVGELIAGIALGKQFFLVTLNPMILAEIDRRLRAQELTDGMEIFEAKGRALCKCRSSSKGLRSQHLTSACRPWRTFFSGL